MLFFCFGVKQLGSSRLLSPAATASDADVDVASQESLDRSPIAACFLYHASRCRVLRDRFEDAVWVETSCRMPSAEATSISIAGGLSALAPAQQPPIAFDLRVNDNNVPRPRNPCEEITRSGDPFKVISRRFRN